MRQIALSGIVFVATLASASAADPLGEWRVEDMTATIKIVDCNSKLWGVIATEPRPGNDKFNPDAAKKTRPTLGMPILLNMAKVTDEKDKWEGKIYNAQNGKTYDGSIQLKSANALSVEGCVALILCGGQTWTRVVDAASGAIINPATGALPKTPPAPAIPAPPAAKTATSAPVAAPAATPVAPAKTTAPAKGAVPKGPTSSSGGPVSEVCLLPEVAGAPH